MTTPQSRGASLVEHLGVLDCVHCGLCLEHCPTYVVTGRESANPRGRIYMMRAYLEGRLEPSPGLAADLDLCLLCRACESACPSGVRYGEVAGEVRARLRKRGFFRRILMDLVLRHPRRLGFIAVILRFYQRSGLRVVRHILPRGLRRMEESLPSVPAAAERALLPEHSPAVGERRGTVAFLEGCVMPMFFGSVNRDTVRLLTHAGYDVIVPRGSGCCGALHAHDGALDEARAMARVNVKAFGAVDVSHVVINSAGCGSGILDYGHLLGTDEARQLAAKVTDVSRFLLEFGDRLEFQEKKLVATCDTPCHLLHGMKEASATEEMLRRIAGLELIPMAEADRCCGAAGVYFLDQPQMSQDVLDSKLAALESTGAGMLITGNPGCLLQWQAGIARRGLDVQVVHPITLLAAQVRA